MRAIEGDACIVGVGHSEISRRSAKSLTALGIEACIAAIDDAGLKPADIDGLGGSSPPNLANMVEGIGIPSLSWCSQGAWPASQGVRAVHEAAMAVKTRACNYALVYRGMAAPRGGGSIAMRVRDGDGPLLMGGPNPAGTSQQWTAPYGGHTILTWLSLWMRRYMHEYDVPRETFGTIAVTCRKHAALNDRAVVRSPITMSDYLSSRWIAEPFCLYDCDFPVDGVAAVIVTGKDRARSLPHTPVGIVCGAAGVGPRPNWEQWDDMRNMGAAYAGAKLWTLAEGLTPADVDVVELYDGFTFLTVQWLEALGFCAPGEAKEFVQAGRLEIGGELPLNTNGGQLSEGRVHGMGLVAEAVLQLMGRCGARQVADARVSVVSNGGGPAGAAILLRAG